MGAHGGGGWGEAGNTDALSDMKGALGGVHGGYQFQSGNFIAGVEGEATFGNISTDYSETETESYFGTRITYRYNMDVSADTEAAIKGRLGYALGPVLLYATGGIAWTWFDIEASATASGGGYTASAVRGGSDVLTGWTAGGGAEMKFTQSISGRLDVSHYKFNDDFNDGGIEIDDVGLEYTVVRAGLTFHLN